VLKNGKTPMATKDKRSQATLEREGAKIDVKSLTKKDNVQAKTKRPRMKQLVPNSQECNKGGGNNGNETKAF